MNSDEARRADAHALLGDPPSDEELARLRRRLRLFWWIVGALLTAALAAVLLTSGHPHGRSVAARVIFGAGLLIGLVGVLIGLVGVATSGSLGRSSDPSMSTLAGPQRRLLLREVQGRTPADPAHLDLARSLALRISFPKPALPFSFGGLVLLLGAGWLGHPSEVRIAVLSVATVFFLGLLVLGTLQARRARRFLAEHPAPTDGSGDER